MVSKGQTGRWRAKINTKPREGNIAVGYSMLQENKNCPPCSSEEVHQQHVTGSCYVIQGGLELIILLPLLLKRLGFRQITPYPIYRCFLRAGKIIFLRLSTFSLRSISSLGVVLCYLGPVRSRSVASRSHPDSKLIIRLCFASMGPHILRHP